MSSVELIVLTARLHIGANTSFKNRIDERRNHTRRNTTQISVITEHQHSHDFDWENMKILDKEIHFNKRLISEMIFIKKQKGFKSSTRYRTS